MPFRRGALGRVEIGQDEAKERGLVEMDRAQSSRHCFSLLRQPSSRFQTCFHEWPVVSPASLSVSPS